ncbi:MAG: DUF6249 domain-containing protein [Acidobacteriota bacterium]|nr:DUF6249 domain-containing protein [Acidobacteriota bacterium]
MRGTDVLLFLVIMAVIVVLPSLFLRYKSQTLRHRERVLALEKGAQLPLESFEREPPFSPRTYLLRGMMWLFSGIAGGIFLAGLAMTTIETDSLDVKLWRAERMRQSGLPEDALKKLIADPPAVHQKLPTGLSLIGLVPVGVGLAYLIFYASERKREGASGLP